MIVVTGAAGFIGSGLAGFLNQKGFENLLLVDDFSVQSKQPNLVGKVYQQKIGRLDFPDWLRNNADAVRFIFHLGARTDTTSHDELTFTTLNVNYSKALWHICSENKIPMVYASSAATYGGGEQGYDDRHVKVPFLQPLNLYGQSKQDFDKWVLSQKKKPPFWAGLKFFNVYGPNEYHKGRMASVVFHAYRQIKETGKVKLFRSHNPQYKDGEQLRDFIYVKDVYEICYFFYKTQIGKGLYNVGTGQARAFNDLVNAVFHTLDMEPNIEFIDTPMDIRDKYQYFTQAEMTKLQKAGYNQMLTSLELGVADYVKNYLSSTNYY